MQYRTGDIITAKVNSKPLLWHQAIAVQINDGIYFLHNSPNRKNEFGGNLLIDTPEDFYKTRTFTSAKHTDLTANDILQEYERLKHKKFNLLLYNCEHFVSIVTVNKRKSWQLRFWTILILLFCLMFYIKKAV